MLTNWLDKGREGLGWLAERLGEHAPTTGSLKNTREACASIKLQLPSIRQILPYESVDEEGLFINKQSVGFGLHLKPCAGADESLVKSMAELIKNKLPAGVDCTVILHKHPYIGADIQRGFEPMIQRGGIYARLAEMSLNYHVHSAKHGYQNGRNLPAQLADYRCYLFFSMRKNTAAVSVMHGIRSNIESELHVAGMTHARLSRTDFMIWMRTLVSPDMSAAHWPEVADDKDVPISHLVPQGNSLITVHDLNVDIDTSDLDGNPQSTRIVNCQIEKWPDTLALWQTPDVFANLLRPEHGIPCSFLISFTIRGVAQEKIQAKAKMRAKTLNANANPVQLFLNPGARDEAVAWNFIHEEGSRDNLALLPTFYNLMLFTTEENEREHVAKAIGAYRQLGFVLQQSRATQWVRYLASLPFFMTEGLFSDLSLLGNIKQMTHHNIANLMPIVADMKGSRQGMLLPTHRHQLAFLDTFDSDSLPITNFNFLTVGSPGAGKSMFQQAQILSGLALGEMTYVIDLGDSYKHLCGLVGGTYIDVSTIALNPFTLFDFDGKTELKNNNGRMDDVANSIQIRDLLAIMASPHMPICDVQKSYLLDASRTCWQYRGRESCMDDVLDALRERAKTDEGKDDIRLTDLILLLKKYGRDGMYGHVFNGVTPLLNQSNLVVFEMGGLQGDPDLMTIVMFVMIVIIQGQFYQTDRRLKKRCIIDEAWRFLTQGSNPIAANFIEMGFRTARKHNGGFGVITQYLADTETNLQGQAIASSSDIKIIMRQGNFHDYVTANPTRFSPLEQQMISAFGDVKGSGFSNVMIEAGNSTSFHRYFADPYSRILFSSSGTEYGAVEALVESGVSLEDAVHQVVMRVAAKDGL